MTNATKPDALEMLRDFLARAEDDHEDPMSSRDVRDAMRPAIAALEAEREAVATTLREQNESYAELLRLCTTRDAKIRAQLIDAEKFLERDDNREGAIFAIARALAIFNAPGYDAIGEFNA